MNRPPEDESKTGGAVNELVETASAIVMLALAVVVAIGGLWFLVSAGINLWNRQLLIGVTQIAAAIGCAFLSPIMIGLSHNMAAYGTWMLRKHDEKKEDDSQKPE